MAYSPQRPVLGSSRGASPTEATTLDRFLPGAAYMAPEQRQGRLLSFTAVPPERDTTSQQATAFDRDPLFAAAGLDRDRFTEVEPRWIPSVAFDRRIEWMGTAASDPEVPLRLTAAAWRGRPVHFEVRGPWSRAEIGGQGEPPWVMIEAPHGEPK